MRTERRRVGKWWCVTDLRSACVIFGCAMLLLPLPSGCREEKQPAQSTEASPPELTGCTRIDVNYLPSAIESFFYHDRDKALLSETELAHLNSLGAISVDDPNRIDVFAKTVASGVPGESLIGTSSGGPYARLICYRGAQVIASLTVSHNVIATPDGLWLRYSGPNYHRWRGPLMGILLELTPDLRPLVLRQVCGNNLEYLSIEFKYYTKKEQVYPPPSQWCDSLVRYWNSNDNSKRLLTCPSVGGTECCFAMNPDCKPDSPPDTVLLFETQAGWNQHGGPTLFTFDHHDPRGGLVLLNDDTVKFIRTEEELKQLRWK